MSIRSMMIGGAGARAPDAPTIGTATAGSAEATVTFSAPADNGGSAITGFTVTSSPGGITGTGASSPITVSGLTNGTAYTFTVTATNAIGTGPASAASNSVTPVAVDVGAIDINLSSLSFEQGFNGSVSSALGLTFNPTGTVFLITNFSAGTVSRFTCSSGFDLSTAGLQDTFGPGEGNLSDVRFSSTGNRLYIIDRQAPIGILQYNMSTPYSFSGMSFAGKYSPPGDTFFSGGSGVDGLWVSSDNTKFIVGGQSSGCPLRTYIAATPGEVTTLSPTTELNLTNLNSGFSSILGFSMDDAGRFGYAFNFSADRVLYKFRFNTPGLTAGGATYIGNVTVGDPGGTFPFSNADQIYIKNGLNKLFVVQHSSGIVQKYGYSTL